MSRVAVITVSDRVSRGEAEDRSGPAIAGRLRREGLDVEQVQVVPDEADQIEAAILGAAARAELVLTRGVRGSALVTPRRRSPPALPTSWFPASPRRSAGQAARRRRWRCCRGASSAWWGGAW